MSLKTGDLAAIVAVGVGALLVIGGGIFRAATIRGDMNARWTRRVAFATAALDEKTISELEQLRDEVDRILPEGPFNPAQALADPAPLSERAERTTKYYRARRRMEGDLALLRKLGPVIVAGLVSLEVAAAILTAFFAEFLTWDWLRSTGLVLLGLAILVLVLAAGTFVVTMHRLTTGEVLAGTGGQADAGGQP